MKKLFITLVSLLMSISSFAEIASGKCGYNVTWSLSDDGTLTIDGEGNISNYDYYSYATPWEAYKDIILKVSIGDNVTNIGNFAFYECSNLTNVTIGNSVTSIGGGAFCECSSLTSVIIPNSVTNIGVEAFEMCTSLTNVTIGNSVTRIGGGAFAYCESLTNVIVPNSVEDIREAAFGLCVNLTNVTLGNSVRSIGVEAFAGCSNLTNVIIPNSVWSINEGAFTGCDALTDVTDYATVPQWLGRDVFSNYVTVHVLPGCKAAYEEEDYWRFYNIVEDAVLGEPDTDLTTLNNSVYLEKTEAKTGSTHTLSLKMKNDFDVTGFQCDICLPEGIEFVTDEDNIPSVALSTARTTTSKTNFFDAQIQEDGTVRLLCNSTKGFAFSGHDGEVATIDIYIPEDMDVRGYPIEIKKIELSDATGFGGIRTERFKSTLVVLAYKDGDANGDKEIDVSDVALTVEHILGHSPCNFNFAAADLDKDNTIDVADVSMMVNIIMYGSVSSPINASKMITEQERTPYLYVTSGGQTLNLWLANADNLVSAMQFDLALPQGVELRDVLPSSFMTQHSVSSSLMDNGMTRVLCISLNNSLMSPDEHGIMAMSLSEKIGQLRDLYLKNIIISPPDGAKKHLADVAVANTTDMKLLMGEQQNKDIYSLNGQKRQSVQKGLNIIKASDGSYKKIIIKK